MLSVRLTEKVAVDNVCANRVILVQDTDVPHAVQEITADVAYMQCVQQRYICIITCNVIVTF